MARLNYRTTYARHEPLFEEYDNTTLISSTGDDKLVYDGGGDGAEILLEDVQARHVSIGTDILLDM